MGTASTAYGTKKTAQAKLYSTSAPLPPRELASTITTATEASCATSVAMPAVARDRTRAPIPAGNRSAGPQPQAQPGDGDERRDDQRRHPGGGPGGQHDPGRGGHRPGHVLVAVADRAEPEVRADDDQAGQHRRQRGRDEPAV